jgi:hypothetical protein
MRPNLNIYSEKNCGKMHSNEMAKIEGQTMRHNAAKIAAIVWHSMWWPIGKAIGPIIGHCLQSNIKLIIN